jgi:hypothetical protein
MDLDPIKHARRRQRCAGHPRRYNARDSLRGPLVCRAKGRDCGWGVPGPRQRTDAAGWGRLSTGHPKCAAVIMAETRSEGDIRGQGTTPKPDQLAIRVAENYAGMLELSPGRPRPRKEWNAVHPGDWISMHYANGRSVPNGCCPTDSLLIVPADLRLWRTESNNRQSRGIPFGSEGWCAKASAGVQKFEQVRREHICLTRQKIVAGSIACGRYHCGFCS